MATEKKVWKRKRVRVLGVIALALGATVAVPFVFTGTLVRYFIANSDYGPFVITFDSASLNPGGALTINGLKVHDVREHAGKPLVQTRKVRVAFRWVDLASKHFESIEVDGLKVYARAGDDAPVTLLRMLEPTKYSSTPAAPVKAAAKPGAPLRIDQIVLKGEVFVEGYEPWVNLLPPQTSAGVPVRLHVRTSGTPELNITDVAVAVGERDNAATELPTIAAQVHIEQRLAGSPDITIRSMMLKNARTAASRELVTAMWPGFADLPADLQRGAMGQLESVTISGQVTLGEEGRFVGEVGLRGGMGKLEGSGTALLLEDLTLSAIVDVPLNGNALQDMQIKKGSIGAGLIQYGPWRLTKMQGDFVVEEGEANLVQLSTTFADGAIIASGSWGLANAWPDRGVVTVRDVNTAKLLERLPEELRKKIPLTVEGPLSGKVTLTERTEDSLSGRVEIATTEALTVNVQADERVGLIELRGVGISGQVDWSLNDKGLPVISRGRVWGTTITAGSATISSMAATVSMNSAGLLRINEIGANVGNEGELTGMLHYAVTTKRIEKLAMMVTDIDPGLLSQWTPAAIHAETLLSASLTVVPSAEAANYSATLQVTLPENSTIHYDDSLMTIHGRPTVDINLEVGADLKSVLAANASVTGFSAVTLSDDLVMKLTEKKEALTSGGLRLDLGKISVAGTASTADGTYAGTLEIRGMGAEVKRADGTKLELAGLGMKVPFVVPMGFSPLISRLQVKDAKVEAASFAYGPNAISGLSAQLSYEKSVATLAPGSSLRFANGTITGGAVYGVTDHHLDSATFSLSKLDQSVIVRNLLTEKFGAEGTISGEVKLLRNERDQLVGSIDVEADGPGRLRFSEEVAGVLAPVAKQALMDSKAPMPANLDQVVTAQLKNYPYASGKVTARDSSGDLVVQLEYTRLPLVAGEPGYAVPVQYEGNAVTANYPIHFKGTSLSVPRKTVMDILALGAGLGELLPVYRRPGATEAASRPATTAPASTGPAATRPD